MLHVAYVTFLVMMNCNISVPSTLYTLGVLCVKSL